MIFISIGALLISVASIILAFFSFRRTGSFQDYEYATRLQMSDERLTFGTETLPYHPALSYVAAIENRGLKPVKIRSIRLDYGDKLNSEKRMKRSVEGEIYLSPGEKREVGVDIAWQDIEHMKKRFDINQAIFSLRVSYHDPKGEVREATRNYGGFDGSSCVSVVNRGDALT
ncbi:MAG: hypothetical protein ACREA9_00165 [Pyrinomonadaceae bacterium]